MKTSPYNLKILMALTRSKFERQNCTYSFTLLNLKNHSQNNDWVLVRASIRVNSFVVIKLCFHINLTLFAYVLLSTLRSKRKESNGSAQSVMLLLTSFLYFHTSIMVSI